MSRASSRGVKEKPKYQPAPLTSISPEIVPGKFTENDWINMLEKDNTEDFIHDFVEEILGQTMVAIFKLYLHKQVVPFTVFQAKNDLLHIIEWCFIIRDEGEVGIEEAGWLQDEEPDAVVTDCWAQGCVPKMEMETPSFFHGIESVSVESVEKTKRVTELENELSECVTLKGIQKVVSEDVVLKKNVSLSTETIKSKKKKTMLKPHEEKLKRPAKTSRMESVKQTVKMPETRKSMSTTPQISGFKPAVSGTHRKSMSKNKHSSRFSEVERDEMGNIVSFVKLEPDTLPQHIVSVRYHVVEQGEGSQMRLDATRQKWASKKEFVRFYYCRSKSRRCIPIPCPPSFLESIDVVQGVVVKQAGRTKRTFCQDNQTVRNDQLESISLVEGVVVTEAGRTKKMSRRATINEKKSRVLDHHLKDMRPIRTCVKDMSNAISASDLLENPSPILRSLDEKKPLPPILPASANNDSFST